MLRGNLKYSGVPNTLILAQLTAIFFYLNANIVNVGEGGAALAPLATYVGLSGVVFLLLSQQRVLFFRLHFLLFLAFLAWIALRVVIDLGSLERLKAITIATTGGILLFYLLGAFFNMSYMRLHEQYRKEGLQKIILLTFFGLTTYLFINLLSRMRAEIFLIADLDGAYQRPGNFLSISFIMASAVFISLLSSWSVIKIKKLKLIFWFFLYSLTAVLALISAQLFGSNSATAVMAGIYILTVVTVFFMRNRKLQRLHANGILAFPFGMHMMRSLFIFLMVGVTFLIFLLFVLVQASNFDLMSIRLFGFGTGTNTSLVSRFDILAQTGVDQISYAPLLGNMNVAYLVTGNAGKTLHSFFPFIFANLGLFGLLIIIVFFILVIRQLIADVKLESRPDGSLVNSIASLYFIFILLFILFFANLAVGVTWPVIWFVVGFLSKPFEFKSRVT